MRARSKRLTLSRLSQSNPHNKAADVWCGRTVGAVLYNYYVVALFGGSEADWIRNQWDKAPYEIIFPDGTEANYGEQRQCKTTLALQALFAKNGRKWEETRTQLYPVRDQMDGKRLVAAGRGSLGPVTPDLVERQLAPLLDSLDDNNPVLLASGLTRAGKDKGTPGREGAAGMPSHFVIISGYSYDDQGKLWLQIDDPAGAFTIVQELLHAPHNWPTRNSYREYIKPLKEPDGKTDSWGCYASYNSTATPRGALYDLRADVLFLRNPYTDGMTFEYERGPLPNALLCDNNYETGFAVALQPGLKVPNNPLVATVHNVSWPIDPPPKGDAAIDWTAWTAPDAPWAVGSSLTWHSGTHLKKQDGDATPKNHGAAKPTDNVYSIGPGSVVLVRAPAEPPAERDARAASPGMVLVRHEYDPVERRVLSPAVPAPPGGTLPPEPEATAAARARAVHFYSLYMHLAPLSTLLDGDGYATVDTPRWLQNLAPERVPSAREFIADKRPCKLATWRDAALTTLAELPSMEADAVRGDISYAKPRGVVHLDGTPAQTLSLEGTPHVVLSRKYLSAAYRDAWRHLTFTPTLAAQAPLFYYNPLTEQVIPVGSRTVAKGQELCKRRPAVAGQPGAVELAVVAERDGQCYVAVDVFAHPGVIYRDLVGATIVKQGFVRFHGSTSVALTVETAGGTREPGGTLSSPAYTMRFALPSGPLSEPRPAQIRPQLHACVVLNLAEFRAATKALAPPPPGRSRNPVPRPRPTAPEGRALQFFNPMTEEILETPLRPGTTGVLAANGAALVVLAQRDQMNYVAVEAFAAVLETSEVPADAMTISTQSALVVDDPAASITLNLNTLNLKTDDAQRDPRDERDERCFEDGTTLALSNRGVALLFPVRECATTGPASSKRAIVDRVWLDLHPCVRLPRAKVDELNTQINSATERQRSAVLERLDAGRSSLFAVPLGPDSRWELRDGLVRPTPDAPAPTPTPTPRPTPTPDAATPEAAPETPPGTQPSPAPPGLPRSLRRVGWKNKAFEVESASGDAEVSPWDLTTTDDFAAACVYELKDAKGKTTAALIEVLALLADSTPDNNQPEIDAKNSLNAQRAPFMAELRRGGVHSIEARGDMRVGRELIGRMAAEEVRVEVFAGSNVVDAAATGTHQGLDLVPNSTWTVLRDNDAYDAYSPEFVERLYTLFTTTEHLHVEPAKLDAEGRDGVVKPTEWLEFSQANALELSRMITVHHSLWRPEAAGLLADNVRGSHLTPAERAALRSEIERLAWWGPEVALAGIDPREPVYHYHPLRFVEWLTTGLDVQVSGATDPKVRIQLDDGSPAVALTRESDRQPPQFHHRQMIGDRRPSARATITVEGLASSHPQLTVLLKRGETKRIEICQPHIAAQIRAGDVAPLSLPMPVSTRVPKSPSCFLLADDNTKLPRAGYGYVVVTFVGQFNLVGPTRLVATLSRPEAFRITDVRASGSCTFTVPPGPYTGAVEITAGPAPRNPAGGSAEYFEAPQAFTLSFEVAARGTTDAVAKLTLSASGGDLVGTVNVESATFETRTIKKLPPRGREGTPTVGADVAKLQLLLSQIPAADHAPCYRAASGSAVVDGDYGRGMANALWRFIYAYVNDPTEPWRVREVRCTTSAGGKPQAPRASSITVDALRTVDGREERLGDKCVDYPEVDAALIAEVTRRFRVPYVLPRVDLDVAPLALPEPPETYPITSAPVWNATLLGRSAILPCGDDAITLRVRAPDLVTITGARELKLKVLPASAYRIRLPSGLAYETVVTLAGDAQTAEVTLVYSGNPTAVPELNSVSVRTVDGTTLLAGLDLTGARDASVETRQPGRDIALLQLYLSQRRDVTSSTDEPYYRLRGKGKVILVDGNWSKEFAGSLARYKANAPGGPSAVATYPLLVQSLRRAYLSPPDLPPAPTPTPAPPATTKPSPPAPPATPPRGH